jgi:hypothetical protein
MTKKKLLVDLMLDSGAYSSWARQKPISFEGYIQFVKDHEDYLYSYVNMDVIPGAPGRKRTQDEVEQSAKLSYANFEIMKSHGLKPMPVFHHGEDFSWFERLLKGGETYIGISRSGSSSVSHLVPWFDRIFSMICDAKGQPQIRTHGLGVTNAQLLFRYPWTTVDSTSWVMSGVFASLLIPPYVNGKPCYSRPPVSVKLSDIKSGGKRQFEAMGDMSRELVERFLREEVKLSISEVRNLARERFRVGLTYFQRLAKHLEPFNFAHRRGPQFMKGRAITREHLKIFYATNLTSYQSSLLTEMGASTRLLNYWDLWEASPKRRPKSRDPAVDVVGLIRYVTEGDFAEGNYQFAQPSVKSWSSPAYRRHRAMGLLKRLQEVEDAT